MNVYEVRYAFGIDTAKIDQILQDEEISPDKDFSIDVGANISDTDLQPDENTKPGNIEEVIGSFHVGAENFPEAANEAIGRLKEMLEGNFKIISVIEMPEINLINWPLKDNPFDIEGIHSEDLLVFTCKCGLNIKCKDGWEQISCPSCGKEIDRDNVIGKNGKYILVDFNKKG